MSVLIIMVFGMGLAWLSRNGVLSAPRPTRDVELASVSIPDDLWEAFNATVDPGGDAVSSGASLLATATGRRTTVGGLEAGRTGWVALSAVVVDDTGDLWVDAAAVVHPAPRQDHTPIRRNGPHYELRDPGPLRSKLGSASPSRRTSIRIHTLYT